MELIYHPAVRSEVGEAARYYSSRREGLGDSFLQSVDAGVQQIMLHPLTWPLVGRRVRRYVLHRFRHHIIYAVTADRIIIVAVAHDRRKPGYWHDRLKNL